ncbi:MAG: DNA replication and repair protein RecF [Actinomycetota bacterium]|nr:DNA replication and repair protein RecF [Actinomycetota bacterium]
MIEGIEIAGFRNYELAEFVFREGINAIIGNNGRGKTNLLEALYFSLQGKPMRGSDVKEMVKRGADSARLRIRARGAVYMEKGLEIKGGGERRESGSLEGYGAVSFQPDDLWMIKGGPEARRRQLDEALSEIKKGYRVTLREYHRVLRQRNEAIRAAKKGLGDRELLRSWSPLLLRWGTAVVRERAEGLGELGAEMARMADSWGMGEIKLRYYSNMWEGIDEPEKLTKKVERLENTEIGRGMTLIGPHRDEIVFEMGGRNARRECSQGEQKLIALMWKIALARTIKNRSGREIILLVDDALSELDRENRRLVVEELKEWRQVFLTHTEDIEELAGAEKIFLDHPEKGISV